MTVSEGGGDTEASSSHPHQPLIKVIPIVVTEIPWMLRTMPSVSQSEMFRNIRMPSQGLRTRVHSDGGWRGISEAASPTPSKKELVEPRHQAA